MRDRTTLLRSDCLQVTQAAIWPPLSHKPWPSVQIVSEPQRADSFQHHLQAYSRQMIFAPEKLEGRKRVYQKAVLLLETRGKENLLPEAKFMAGAVIGGYSRRRLFKDAGKLIEWSADHQVFSPADRKIWLQYNFYNRFRLYKLTYLKKRMDALLKPYYKESSIGKVVFRKDS